MGSEIARGVRGVRHRRHGGGRRHPARDTTRQRQLLGHRDGLGRRGVRLRRGIGLPVHVVGLPVTDVVELVNDVVVLVVGLRRGGRYRRGGP
ncbi:hypothetical protein [Curtobacterium sp. MCPF17_052]|uniref:hypothetical protein n=1 Tax=Curtobacterium sp. MCPF17_052 TaxID=2175655 RepID=UPI0024DF32DB|nr:hypothetical protein [Curtobacterium sp. MCPF17_052]WIB11774.1 hypothetical protein DEJ36_12850 [Curtobacterium sp. MCPF17_052]